MDIALPSTSKTKPTKKIKKSKAKEGDTERTSSESKKKRKDKSEENLSSETNSRLKKISKKLKKTDTLTEIKQKDQPQKKRKNKGSKSSVTKSPTNLEVFEKEKQHDEGSQSSLVDFVSLTKQNVYKKKKGIKESKNTFTKPGLEEKSVKKKKKKQKDEECQSNITKAFAEVKQKDMEKTIRKGKESKSTVSNSEMKQKSCTEKKQIADESEITTSNSDIEENASKNKKGKEKVQKKSETIAETEQGCLKKKRNSKERQSSITNFVIKLNTPKPKTRIETVITTSLTNSDIEQNDPSTKKQESNTIRTSLNDSGDEENNRKDIKGKDKKASCSRTVVPKSKQNVAKKRKRKSEVKPRSSKRRKKDLSALQQSQEERDQREDAFLIHHPHLANHIKDKLYCENLEGSSFTAMSAMLKECILREEWEDANRIQCTMCMYQTPNVDCLWKFGAHVLQNHPSGNAELVEDLYRFVRKISTRNPYEKKLEHALFLLQQDRMKEALTTLTEMWGVSHRGKLSDQQEILKKLTSAYAGLIEYCQWHEITKTREGDEEEREVTSKEAATLRKRALVNLSKFNDDPGVWDIFITKQVEMLEADGSIRKTEELLTKYLNHNRENPNAHVYLYQFLKRNHPTKNDKLKPVLKELSTLLPAEDYTLEYVELMEKTGSADLSEVLPMLFNMADYSTCHSNLALWENLVEHVISIVESTEKTAKALLSRCWSCRKSWWTSYHFDKHGASDLVKRNPEVALQKAILAAIFFGSSNPFVQKILTALQKKTPELSKDLENEISLWCKPAL